MTERWKAVVGFEGIYEVSNLGRVRSLERRIFISASARSQGYWRRQRARLLQPAPDDKGYQHLTLWKDHESRQTAVHVLVLEAFVGPRPVGSYGCHRNGNPRTNKLDNLYWGTPTENSADKRRHGTHRQGSAIPWARLTEADVRRIRSLKGKVSQQKLASEYGVRQNQISRVMNGQRWRHIPSTTAREGSV